MFSEGRSFSGLEKNCAFLNTSSADEDTFANISAVSGFDFADDGRAIATVDWDHDGDLDLWVANRNAPQLRFLRNDAPRDNHYLSLRLEGNGKTVPRDAIGSRVSVITSAAGKPLIETLRAGEGFLTQSSKWLHFGLGEAQQIEKILVRWTDGTSETFESVAVDGRYLLKQGSGRAIQSPGVKRELRIAPGEPAPLRNAKLARIPCVGLLTTPTLLYLKRPFSSQQIIETGNGSPVLINLWSSSCQPCLKELNEFKARHEELQAAGIQVLALTVDPVRNDREEVENAQNLIASNNYPFVTGYADWKLIFLLQSLHNSIVPSGRLLPVPTSFLIDGEGRLAVLYKGPVGVDQVIEDLDHSTRTPVERYNRMFEFGGAAISHERSVEVITSIEDNAILRFAFELELSQRHGSAMDQYRELLERSPRHALAHLSMGNLLVGEKQFEEGVSHLKQAIAIDPDFAQAHFRLGIAELLQDRLTEAIPHLEESIRLTPTDYPSHLTLGAIYERLGQLEDAVVHLEHALLIRPGDEKATEMLDSIRRRQ